MAAEVIIVSLIFPCPVILIIVVAVAFVVVIVNDERSRCEDDADDDCGIDDHEMSLILLEFATMQ